MSSQQLWLDYVFLTKEMVRFAGGSDVDDGLFLDLMDQRQRLQEKLSCQRNDAWLSSADGRAVLFNVGKDNVVIMQKLRAALQRMKQQQSISQAYDGYGNSYSMGGRLDQKR